MIDTNPGYTTDGLCGTMIFGQLCRIGVATLKKFGAVEITTPEKADEGDLVTAEEPAATGFMTP